MKIEKGFSFVYGGRSSNTLKCAEIVKSEGETQVFEYIFEDTLKVTKTVKKYKDYDAIEWINEFENISNKNTEVISELFDAVFTYETEADDEMPGQAWKLRPEHKTVKINAPSGSDCSGREFLCDSDYQASRFSFPGYLLEDEEKVYGSAGGLSSDAQAPYFEISQGDKGYIAAVGWSGKWRAVISRKNNIVEFKSGIAKTGFYLKPNEKISTSSVLVMEYNGGTVNAHNKWRRLLKNELSVMVKRTDKTLPLSAGLWGGMKTEDALKRIDAVCKAEWPVDYFWMDAGWYGTSDAESPDEFEGDWWMFAGDWIVNENHHPNGLKDIVDRIKQNGKKFLLWFEPERAKGDTAPIVIKHPEYFLNASVCEDIVMLNLGNEEAWEYIFNLMASIVERLSVSFFRQDFNFDTCDLYWIENDEENRIGITEIKYINGLYKFWAALLEKFPGLLIDNCAGGGRRLDYRALKYSVPLWRSDAQCPANPRPDIAQNNMLGFNDWLVYSGTCSGRIWGDMYDFRSAYGTSLQTTYTFSARDSFCDNTEQLCWVNNAMEEYIKVRDYFSCDFYPLTKAGDSLDIWTAARFDRPEQGDGIILAFRRENSNYKTLSFEFENAKQGADYIFADADTNESFILSAQEIKNGIEITIPEKRKSKLIFYNCK